MLGYWVYASQRNATCSDISQIDSSIMLMAELLKLGTYPKTEMMSFQFDHQRRIRQGIVWWGAWKYSIDKRYLLKNNLNDCVGVGWFFISLSPVFCIIMFSHLFIPHIIHVYQFVSN